MLLCFQAVCQVLAVKIVSLLAGDPRFWRGFFGNLAAVAAKPSASDRTLFSGPVFSRMYADPRRGHCEHMNILAFQKVALMQCADENKTQVGERSHLQEGA